MTEEDLHKQIVNYIKTQYPKVIFNTDMSGIRLTKEQAKKAKQLRSSNGFPDLTVYEISGCKKHSALFLEIKKETPYKKNGELKKMMRIETISGIKIKYDHLKRQNEMHKKLRERGYRAEFAWDFVMAKKEIDDYLN